MQVDVYDLLGVLQSLAYTAGECDAAAKAVDSEGARKTLLDVGRELKNAADDVRMMFDGLAEGAVCGPDRVVTCAECRHARTETHTGDEVLTCWYRQSHGEAVDPGHFCGYGEVKRSTRSRAS